MKIIRSPQAMTAWSENLRRQGVTIGFVPTMGALHDGHRALIREARLRCDALVVSIFVNPTQFGQQEDLTKYPRALSQDRALCRKEEVDVCFEPTVQAMYPNGFQTVVTLPTVARRWEGEIRPHHFPGVATVVTKLFGIVRPQVALFGQKDFQQSALVRQLVKDLNLGLEIVVHPTVREADGLAMSSRNVYLSRVAWRGADRIRSAYRQSSGYPASAVFQIERGVFSRMRKQSASGVPCLAEALCAGRSHRLPRKVGEAGSEAQRTVWANAYSHKR
ncbi:MAG: pantoate--beta-alanine ligase [Nitrospirae bacterium]|nr:pantoate--beta-alanine ligase [Nitrospirota bacterium]